MTASALLLLLAAALPAVSAFAPTLLTPSLRASPMTTRPGRSAPLVSAVSMQQQGAGGEEGLSVSRRSLLSSAVAAAVFPSLSAYAADTTFVPPVGGTQRPVVVLGASGKTGKLCVLSLMNKGGYSVRACTRGEADVESFQKLTETDISDLEIITGVDVTKKETLPAALKNAGAVIFASSASKKGGNAEKVDCIGVENVAQACVDAGVSRLVVISSCCVTRPDSVGYKLTNLFGNIMDYKAQGEEKLREVYRKQKGLSYTILRPGGLKDSNKKEYNLADAMLTQGDVVSSEIDRGVVAEVAVAAIFQASAADTTIECFDKKGKLSLLGKGLDPQGVSGQHVTSAPWDYTSFVKGQKSAEELFTGLKKDTEYDANNGYVARKKV
eukprot:CAMPEP_0173379284 /NCGR_PEP_ID=MMETSP1356-20130122/2296_1 /TAXON_ID=77927 ORGANISM="Hemiselmis virescens, Strain PCC157" /NCGR_SAMPLE_ID=MMETSP1356 /ASSEMBLY_ACC=CAM_ASM_000847 /LENGTH=382 /DNA_ID=CAMNT_0014332597 /DNA_START=83 /DNA_END=1231 /DNA_ORIENTATION=+